MDRQRLPDLLRADVPRIGDSGRPVRPQAGDARGHRRLVAGLHRRRPGADGLAVCRVPRHPGTGRADDLRRTAGGRDALVREAAACDGQQPLYGRRIGGRGDRTAGDRMAHALVFELAGGVPRGRCGGSRHRGAVDGRLPHAVAGDSRPYGQRRPDDLLRRGAEVLHAGRAFPYAHAVGRLPDPSGISAVSGCRATCAAWARRRTSRTNRRST